MGRDDSMEKTLMLGGIGGRRRRGRQRMRWLDASLTWWTWVWMNSGSWLWTGRPGVLQFMGLQRVGLDWVTELNWAWPHPSEQDPVPSQSVSPIRKLPEASYPSPSEGRQGENHNHRKLTNLITALSNSMKLCLTRWNYEPGCIGPPKMDGSWWRVLTKCGPLEKGMANHFSILALRTPWTIWKWATVCVVAKNLTGLRYRHSSKIKNSLKPK